MRHPPFLIKTIMFPLLIIMIAINAPELFSDTSPDGVISIIFTHDLHSHFDPERFVAEGRTGERGGLARVKSAIDGIRSQYPDSFLLDAGDFAMGTLYQTIFQEEASELRMLGLLGYDAVTLGNHEFDYRTQGLTGMLNAAMASGWKLPALTIANIDWERTLADSSRAAKAAELRAAMEYYGSAGYLIIEKGGVKAAVFGILGREADSYAPQSGLYFKDPIETAKATVAQIKAGTDAGLIICLSHSGTNSNPKKSEDELLAAAVPEIDVIISGHTHTRLENPITVGNTLIVSGGAYSYDLGYLRLVRDGSRFRAAGYELIPIRENIVKDTEAEKAISNFRELVNRQYLDLFGYSYDEVLAYTDFDFTPIEHFAGKQGEDSLGNLISDSYIAAVKKAEGSRYRSVDAAVVPAGVVRGSFTRGTISVADAFNVSSLGIGPDRIPGYPLVNIYLTGEELRTVAEIDISISTLMTEARLYISGLSYSYNPNRLLLNRVTETQLINSDGSVSKLDDKKLYRVIGGLYSCQMLGAVEGKSFGLLKITPKDENGNPIVNFEEHLIYDGTRELKEWVALAQYLQSFSPVNGIPQISGYYNQLQGRKTENLSRSPMALLAKPNKIFFLLSAVVLLLLAIIIVPVCLIILRLRRKRSISKGRI